jgi:hypothetical protein
VSASLWTTPQALIASSLTSTDVAGFTGAREGIPDMKRRYVGISVDLGAVLGIVAMFAVVALVLLGHLTAAG